MITREELLKPPIMFFGMPMGLLGIALEMIHLEKLMSWTPITSLYASFLAWTVLTLLIILAIKNLTSPVGRAFYKAQWLGSVTLFDFSILPLTAMMLMQSIDAWIPLNKIGIVVFYAVAAFHTFLNFAYISRWLKADTFDIAQFRVSVFILLSGNFMVVITGYRLLPDTQSELLWFYFSVSLLFWFVFLFFFIYRLMFESRLPEVLRPSLFIFLSPPSLGMVSYAILSKSTVPSGLTWALFYGAFFFLILWVYSINHFRKLQPSMIGWAYIFPLASFDLAAQTLYRQTGLEFFLNLAVWIMFLNIAIAFLLLAFMARALFVKNEAL